MANIERHERTIATAEGIPGVSWGGIFAGLVVLIGTSWLLYLLGMAIGVSVADASDSTLMGEGLPEGAAVWIVLSSLVAYFIAGAVASRLAAIPDDTAGMLHGFAVWGAGTTAMLVLGYLGLNNLLQTGQSFLSAAASVGSSTATAITDLATGSDPGAGDKKLPTDVREELRKQVSDAIAETTRQEGAELTEEEVSSAMESLSADDLGGMDGCRNDSPPLSRATEKIAERLIPSLLTRGSMQCELA